jgi:hypothetical protein
MSLTILLPAEKSRLRALLDHFSVVEDPREPWRVAHPLPEVLLLVLCGLRRPRSDRRVEPNAFDVPASRPALPSRYSGRAMADDPDEPHRPGAVFFGLLVWVRETWPDRLDLVAIDGKTSRRSHDRGADKAPLHLVSAFATTSRLVLGQ